MFYRVYFDTAPLIYFLDRNDIFYERMRDFIFACIQNENQFYTSVLTDMEYSIFPRKNNDFDKINNYKNFMKRLNFKKIDVNSEIVKIATDLMIKYNFLKQVDAIQISSCIFYKCDIFITNDKQLLQISEINSLYIETL